MHIISKKCLPVEHVTALPNAMERLQVRYWQDFPNFPLTPIAGGELARVISRDREEKMVCLFLLGWKMCVAVRAEVFFWHSSCLSVTTPWELHTHLLSGGCWRGERHPLHRKSAEYFCTDIRMTRLFFFSPSLKNPLRIFPFFFSFPFFLSFLKAEKCLRNALAHSPFTGQLSWWRIN